MTEENGIVFFKQGIHQIQLEYNSAKVYQHCNKYDTKLMESPKIWHQIVILHKGQLKQSNADRLIIDALYAVVNNAEFYPVAYTIGSQSNKFLVRNCKEAMDNLFANSLCIQINKGPTIYLKVLLNVGIYKYGQIDPHSLISRVVFKQMEKLERHRGINDVLNLSQFGEHREFQHVIVNLSNTTVFEQICQYVARNNECFRNLNGILLRCNYIRTVRPLHVLEGTHFQLIDLSNNWISAMSKFCRDIKKISAHELLIAGNPIINYPKYIECLEKYNLKDNFKMLDGTPLKSVLESNDKIVISSKSSVKGYRIDMTNRNDIMRFENSESWHAILIPDEQSEVTKEEIFDHFFHLLSPDLSEVYPCYYRLDGNAHYFMVHKCFDQLLYLTEHSNFELIISNAENYNDLGQHEQESQLIKPFYMLMSVGPFQPGQVQPSSCIEQAILKRYVLLNRLLDLSNFQSSPGLENIVIYMSSIRILNTILNIAGRKFIDNCFELNLSNNKITSINNPNLFALFRKLERLDLSNNWLKRLESIKHMNVLTIKSVKLTGNPLCRDYQLPHEYVKAVANIFPKLDKLDDVDLKYNPSFLTQKNYLCDLSGYEFVEEFVRKYFQAYESENRDKLVKLYADNALFSLTCSYTVHKNTTKDVFQRVSLYRAFARNIYSSENELDGYAVGSDGIMDILMKLPKVKHDFETFQIDVPHFDLDGRTVIYVSGLYKEHSTAVDKGLLVAFCRRFVLKLCKENEDSLMDGRRYLICNESFSITNPSKSQYNNAFKNSAQSYIKTESTDDNTAENRQNLILILHEVTGLNPMWCNRMFEASQWNYEKTLYHFLEQLDSNEIPKNAWSESDI